MNFNIPRIRLAATYLLVIMAVSLFFSGLIYVSVIRDVEAGFNRAELRYRMQQKGLIPPPRRFGNFEDIQHQLGEFGPPELFVEDLAQAKQNILIRLIILNAIILVISSGISYGLAWLSLKPLEEALEEQKRFVADASHELRTPLTALKTSLEVDMRDKALPKQITVYLEKYLNDVNRMQRLSDSLLELATTDITNQESLIDINETMSMVVSQLQPLADRKQISITKKLSEKNIRIKADQASIEQLVSILLDNAIKFTPDSGKIMVFTRKLKKSVKLVVKDSGIGIDKKHIPRLFDRFYQVDSARTGNNGSGLGLALAKKIADNHNAKISVKSVKDKGTTFTVFIPS